MLGGQKDLAPLFVRREQHSISAMARKENEPGTSPHVGNGKRTGDERSQGPSVGDAITELREARFHFSCLGLGCVGTSAVVIVVIGVAVYLWFFRG